MDASKFYHTPVFKFLQVLLILVIIQVGFGTYAVVLKLFAQSAGVDPLIFSLFRDAASFPILFLAAVLLEGFTKLQLKHMPLFFGLGLTGMFGNQVMYIFGLYYTSPTVASVFQPLIPVITTFLALILRIERFELDSFIHWAKIWGICTAGGGAIIMVMAHGVAGITLRALIGYVLLLGNTSAMAIYVLLQKKYLYVKDINGKDTPLYRPITASAYSYGMGAFLLGVVSLPYGIIYPQVFSNLTYEVLYPLAYAIFISSSLCYALISYAAYLTSATIVTAFWPLQVPVATIESFFVFGVVPLWQEYIGALFIMMGLIAVCVAKYTQENEEAKAKIER